MSLNRRAVVVAFAIFGLLSLASTAVVADETDNPTNTSIESGSHALSFNFPGGGAGWGIPGATEIDDGPFGLFGPGNIPSTTAVAYWLGVSDALQLGIVGGLYVDENDGRLGVAPSLKYFFSTDEVINPYLYGSVGFWVGDDAFLPGLAGGLGLEYFPVEQVSIGGRIGLTIDTTGDDGPWRFWTGTSGLDVNFYF